MRVQLRIDAKKCTGCRICLSYCSFHHERVIHPDLARIRIESETDEGPFRPQVCRQCSARRATEGTLAPCAQACPVEAIHLDDRIGAWLIEAATCTGCGSCVEACPFGMVVLDDERGLALKCDLCGGAPECVQMCPSGAIEVRMS